MRYLLSFILYCCSCQLFAQETYEYRVPIDNFYETYDEGEDIANIAENEDGEFVAVHQYFIDSETQITALMKYASDGHLIWKKSLDLDPDMIFTFISPPEICSYQGRYAMIQNQVSNVVGPPVELKTHHTLTIFDEDGDIIQEHASLLADQQQFTDITLHNGGFLVASTNVTIPGITNRLLVYATDIDGNTLWEKQILLSDGNPTERFILYETLSDINNNIYLFCSTEFAHDGLILIKLDPEGNILFINKYKDPNLDSWGYDPQARAAINSQGDLYCYLTWQNNPGVAQYTNLYKFDNDGEILFSKRVEELVFVTSLSDSSDNGFTILFPNLNDQYGIGFENSKDPALAKFHADGSFDWGFIYGEEGDNFTDRHIVCQDRGYMIFAHTMDDYYMIKTDIHGISGCETHPLTIDPIDFELETEAIEWDDIDFPISTEVATIFIDEDAPELVDKCCLTNITAALFSFDFTENAYEIDFSNSTLNADTYAWNFGDGTNAGYENPVHVFPAAGEYTVCLTAYNECMQDEYCITINVPEPTVGIDEVQAFANIYPNPAASVFEIESKKEIQMISLSNQQGQIIRQTLINSNYIKYQTASLARGMYFLELEYKSGQKSRHKIILQ